MNNSVNKVLVFCWGDYKCSKRINCQIDFAVGHLYSVGEVVGVAFVVNKSFAFLGVFIEYHG